MTHNNHKMLLFDLGGVIIDIDPSITENKFKEISNKSDSKFKGLDYRNEKHSSELITMFFNYEQGFLTDSEFRDGIRKIGGIDRNDKEIDEIWNLVILKINKSVLELIIKLKKKYSIMVLSNTNNIHRVYFDLLTEKIFKNNFSVLFDKVFYSYEMSCRKPDKIIYDKVVDSSGFRANDIIFFDDMKENIMAAENNGMNTYHVKNKKEFKDYLSTLL